CPSRRAGAPASARLARRGSAPSARRRVIWARSAAERETSATAPPTLPHALAATRTRLARGSQLRPRPARARRRPQAGAGRSGGP
ncbi:MAG: hypothetical protein AVDCRST_MAG45-388, partial [uncultured Solirubrobacterales bacterium]